MAKRHGSGRGGVTANLEPYLEASAHLLTITPTAHWLEYLDIAGGILAEPYRGVDGAVTARGPGFGLEWDESAIARFAAERS